MLEKNPGILIKKYSILSFVLLFCIISAYQTVIFIHTWTQTNDAHKVNMAGRQRMLSQRIGKNLLLSFTTNTEKSRNEFLNLTIADINTLADNHAQLEKDILTSSLFAPNNKINHNFSLVKQPLTRMVSAIKTIVQINKNNSFGNLKQEKILHFSSIYFTNETIFLDLMDNVVKSYEIGLQNYVNQLKELSWIGAGFILLVMFINGRFVVYKSIQEVDEQFLEIKNHKEFQDTILSCSLEGIVSINAMGCITLMNKTAEKIFLGQEEDFLGKRITSIIPELDFNHLELMKNHYKTELEGRKKGSILFSMLINVSKIETGNRQGWVIFIQDLSIRKKIEQELSHARQKVTDAVEANNAKSRFLANISHELKTPLNAIIGFSQLLQTDKDLPVAPEHLDYVNYIHQGGTHLLSLINEILDLAMLGNRQLDLVLEIVNVSELVKEALILIYTSASKKHITIINQFSSMPAYYIIADRIRVKQVLLNFLSNAVKYNNNHGTITIEVDRMADDFLKISVIDNGRGIPEDKISQLFEPFNRLGAENSEIEGTGIGLTITKSLVEDMHGKIGVFSEEHSGSTFWVELPLAENHKNAEKITSQTII